MVASRPQSAARCKRRPAAVPDLDQRPVARIIRRIVKLDPLGLRDRLPRPLVEWLFAQFALLVRRPSRGGAGGEAEVTWRDFPVGPPADDCLDLLALCRRPR